MNSFLRLVPLALAALLSACHSNTKSVVKVQISLPVASHPKAPAASPGSSTSFYRQYRGVHPSSADTLELHLLVAPQPHLNAEFLEAIATYYGSDGHPYRLMVSQNVPDSLLLTDISPEMALEGKTSPNWRLHYEKRGLVGTLNGQRIQLQEVHPIGSLSFDVRQYVDSVVAFPGVEDSPLGYISLQALVPKGATPALEISLLHSSQPTERPAFPQPAHWAKQCLAFKKEYQQAAKSMRQEAEKEGPADDSEKPFSNELNQTQQEAAYVLWNRAPLLSIGVFHAAYTGGAHGSYSTQVVTYNTRNGQQIRFDDVFRPGTDAQLSRMLDRAVRLTMGIEEDEPLDKTLSVAHMPVTHNVYFTSGGAVFVYSPYEIASFGEGEVHVFVPLAELKPLMTAPLI